ncbi:hypothetical protein EHI8A_232020, partial [Entamoeba histolytica HM-1:IMSS-B]
DGALIGNMNNIGKQGDLTMSYSITFNCFNSMKKPAEYSIAASINSLCYIHEKMQWSHKGKHNISKCGACMTLIGPSNTPFQCTVAGFFSMTSEIVDDDIFENVILLDENFYFKIGNRFNSSADLFVQVTAYSGDCNYHQFASLYLLPSKEETTKFMVLNSNRVIEKVIVGSHDYYQQDDHTFEVPYISVGESISLVALSGELINAVRHETTSPVIQAETKFSSRIYSGCNYSPNRQVFLNGTIQGRNPYIAWDFFQLNSDLSVVVINATADGVIFNATHERTTIVLHYPTSIQMNQHFSEIYLTLEYKGIQNFLMTNIALNNRRDTLKHQDSTYIEENVTTIIYKENDHTLRLRCLFNRSIKTYANIISFSFITDIGTQFILKNATLKHRIDFIQPSCNFSSTDCSFTECTTNNSSLFEEGCVPECGSCRSGYKCSSVGKCELEQNQNTRNCSFLARVVLLCLVIVTIIV